MYAQWHDADVLCLPSSWMIVVGELLLRHIKLGAWNEDGQTLKYLPHMAMTRNLAAFCLLLGDDLQLGSCYCVISG